MSIATLKDIGDICETVEVAGKKISVYGISAEGFVTLMSRFPPIEKALAGGSITKEELASLGPDALAAFIAAGCGDPGDEVSENIARRIPLEKQMDICESILKMTFPGGLGPFVERLTRFAADLRGAVPQQPSSPSPLKNSSPADTEKEPGNIPRDKSTGS